MGLKDLQNKIYGSTENETTTTSNSGLGTLQQRINQESNKRLVAQEEKQNQININAQNELNNYNNVVNNSDYLQNNSYVERPNNYLYNRYQTINGQNVYDPNYVEGTTPQESYMTDQEKGIYNYLMNTQDVKQADNYYRLLESQLNQKRANAQATNVQNMSNGELALANVVTPMATVMSPLSAVDILAQKAQQGIDTLVGRTPKPLDLNTGLQQSENYKNAVRDETTNRIDSDVGKFLYQTGMSMADSAVAIGLTALGVPNAGFILGTSAGTQGVKEALERGATEGQAILTGLAQGVAEMLFENYSIDKLLSLKTAPTIGKKVLNILAQAGVEGSEEVNTDLANAITDAIINGDKSAYQTNVKTYMANGYSEEEAKKLATKDYIRQLGQSFLGGAVSGGVFAGAGTVASDVRATQKGNQIIKQGTQQTQLEQAKQVGGEAQQYAEKVNPNSKMGLGYLEQLIGEQQVRNAVQKANETYGIKTDEKTIKSLQKQALGQNVTPFDQARINKYNELNDNLAKTKTEEIRKNLNAQLKNKTTATRDETVGNIMKNVNIKASDVVNRTANEIARTSGTEYNADKTLARNTNFMNNLTNRGVEISANNKAFIGEDGKDNGRVGFFNVNTGKIVVNPNASQADVLRFVVAHEMVHRARQNSLNDYNSLSKIVLKQLGINKDIQFKEGQLVRDASLNKLAEVIDAKKDQYESQLGQILNDEDAFEEVVAEYVEDLYGYTDDVEQIFEGKRFLDKFRDTMSSLLGNGNTVKAQNRKVSQTIRNTLNTESTNENRFKVDNGKIVDTSDGTTFDGDNPIANFTPDGTAKLSLSTYENFGKKELDTWLNKRVKEKKITLADANEIKSKMDYLYKVCNKYRNDYAPFSNWSDAKVIVAEDGTPIMSVVKKNGDYSLNLDFSTLCKKRRTLDAVLSNLVEYGVINKIDFEGKDIAKINEIIRQHGFETACALCFVDSKRFRQMKTSEDFVSQYNDLLDSMIPKGTKKTYFNFGGNKVLAEGDMNYTPNFTRINKIISEENQQRKVKKNFKMNTEQSIAHYLKDNWKKAKFLDRGDFVTSLSFTNAKQKAPEVFSLYNISKGVGGSKPVFGDVQYLGEILKKQNFQADRAYSIGGVRVQSFSDYVPRMIFDYIQMFADLTAKKLPAHAYTKEPLFVKQFGLTGLKINMSLIPRVVSDGIASGLDKNGNYVWAKESFDYDTAIAIQNAKGYDKNCGTIAVGVSDEHIFRLLRDPNIKMVIPYHKSGLNPIIAELNNISAFVDYTDYQNTRTKDGKAISKDHRPDLKQQEKNFNELLRTTNDPKKAAKEYLDWCKKNDLIPRFDRFAKEENYYYKLLEDFTVYDKSGKYAPQEQVTMTFPTEDSAFGSIATLIKEGLEEDAVLEGKRDKEVPIISKQIAEIFNNGYKEWSSVKKLDDINEFVNSKYKMSSTRYDSDGNELSKQQSEYFKDSKVRDKDGNLLVVYRGGSKEFTVFDKNYIGASGVGKYEGDGFNFTPSKSRAETYGDGRIFKGYVNVTNPIPDNTKSITLSKLKDMILELDPSGDDIIANYYSPNANEKYGSKTYLENGAKFTAKAIYDYCPSDADVYAQLSVAGVSAEKIIDMFEGYGYDGIIWHNDNSSTIKTVIAFESNQIKNATNEKPTSNEDIRYSDSKYEEVYRTHDADWNELTESQIKYFENSKVRDEQGKLIPMYHGTPRDFGFTIFDPSKSDDNISLFFTSDPKVAETYSGEIKPNNATIDTFKNGFNYTLEDVVDGINNHHNYGIKSAEIRNIDGKKVVYVTFYREHKSFPYHGVLEEYSEEQFLKDFNPLKTGTYKTYLNITNPLVLDVNGSNWNELDSSPYEKLKIEDVLVDGKYATIKNKPYSYGVYNPVSDEIVKTISKQKWDGFDDNLEYAIGSTYWMIENGAYVLFNIGEDGKAFIPEDQATYIKELAENIKDPVPNIEEWEKNINEQLEWTPKEEVDKARVTSDLSQYDELWDGTTTRDVSLWAKQNGYDGVIFKNIVDSGGKGKSYYEPSTIAIAFNSNQVKSVDNKNPTEDSDIRYSTRKYDDIKESLELQKYFASHSNQTGKKYLSLSKERFDKEVSNSANSRDDYAQEYIAWISPMDFLKATTHGEEDLNKIIKESHELNLEELAKEGQTPTLWIDEESQEILSHEGRHRMVALYNAGFDKVAIALVDYETKYSKKPFKHKTFQYQWGQNGTIGISNAIPLAKPYIKDIENYYVDIPNASKYSLTRYDGQQTTPTIKDEIDNAYAGVRSAIENLKFFAKEGTIQQGDFKALEDAYKEVIKLEKQKAKEDQKLNDMDKSERQKYQDFWKQELDKADAKLDKAQQKIANEKKVADIIARYKESIAKARERRNKSQESQQLLRALRQLKQLRKKVPQDFQKQIDDIIGDVNLFGTNILPQGYTKEDGSYVRGKADLEALSQRLEELEKDPNFIKDTAYNNYKEKIDRYKQKQIGDMSIDEVEEMLQSAVALRHQILTYKETVGDAEHKLISTISNDFVKEVVSSKQVKNLKPQSALIKTLRPQAVFKELGGYSGGAVENQYKSLERGQTNYIDYVMKSTTPFDDFVKEHPEVAKWSNEPVTIEANGKKININKFMRISLYMHLQNDDNMSHIFKSGITIPNMELYNKGDIKNAYARGDTIKMDKKLVTEITSQMTDLELQFAKLLQKHFEFAKEQINKTSLALDGYEKALVENYFPINSNQDYIIKPIDDIVRDFRLENMGSLKERTGNKSAILLEDANRVLLRQIENIGKYVGYAIPLRNFNSVYNHFLTDGSTVKGVIRQKAESYNHYIEKLISQLNGNRKGETSAMMRFSGRYASAVLNFNPSVALSQTASYPTAMAVLGAKALRKGLTMGKVDTEQMAKYTPLYWYRTKGYVDESLAATKNAPSWMNKLLGTKWIQAMDLLTTRTLWNASIAWVDDNTTLTKGTDAYWQMVAEKYNQVIYETQPNYTILNRPELLRADSDLTRSLFMFKTQSYQNYNMLYESLGEMRANPTNENRMKFATTSITLLVANAVFSVFKNLAKGFRHKIEDWYDEEDNLEVLWFLDNYWSNMAGSIPLMSELIETLGAITGKYTYDTFSVPAVETVNELISKSTKFGNMIYKAFDSGFPIMYFRQNKSSMLQTTRALFKQISQVAGIPLDNIEKYSMGFLSWFFPELTKSYENTFVPVKKSEIDTRTEFDLVMKNAIGVTNEEVWRLYQSAESKVIPSFDVSNESYGLNVAQQYDVKTAYQNLVKSLLIRVTSLQAYKTLNTDQKVHTIQNIYDYAKEMSLATVNSKYPKTKWISKAKTSPATYIINKNRSYKKRKEED